MSVALSQGRGAQQLLTWAPRHSIPPKALLQATRLGMKTECHSLAISAKAAIIRAASHSDMFHKLVGEWNAKVDDGDADYCLTYKWSRAFSDSIFFQMFRTLEDYGAKFGAVDIRKGFAPCRRPPLLGEWAMEELSHEALA
eukprot:8228528-Pyramimonas_sp.AAC.1